MGVQIVRIIISTWLIFLLSILFSFEGCQPEKESLVTKRRKAMWAEQGYWKNEFYTVFKYAPVKGLGYEEGMVRRDPTTIIKVNDTYYVWYTYQDKEPVGYKDADENHPAAPWDLASIYYATSKDGWEWEEQGVAVTPGPKGNYDDRSVFTPDILVANGKYYLYYQATSGIYRRRTVNVIGMSWAESPDGPWHRAEKPVLKPDPSGEWLGDEDDRSKIKKYGAWDSQKVHDPWLIVRDGKYWIYYKGVPKGRGSDQDPGIAVGVAIAERPEGPFIKSELNPVINSGHETCLWPYKEGVAALVSIDGYEKNTIQYARDGLNFEIKSIIEVPPEAAGIYCPDKYTNTRDGNGFTWGLCHAHQSFDEPWNYLIRFECDLSQKVERQQFKLQNLRFTTKTLFSGKNKLNMKDLQDQASPIPENKDLIHNLFSEPRYDF